MIQFRRKHFNTGLSTFSRIAMETAIWLRAGLSAISTTRTPRASRRRRTWLSGDPEGIARLQPYLAASATRAAAPDELHADEIIYCVGKEFSFETAIQFLERKNPAYTAAFYATGNHAVISSSLPDDQGEIWIL